LDKSDTPYDPPPWTLPYNETHPSQFPDDALGPTPLQVAGFGVAEQNLNQPESVLFVVLMRAFTGTVPLPTLDGKGAVKPPNFIQP
jgi:hypothetical protein